MSIFYDDTIGNKIAKELGYEVEDILSDDHNINGHVYQLKDDLVMKISFEPDFRILERLKDNGYPIYEIQCYQEYNKEYDAYDDFSICIREDIPDIEAENEDLLNLFLLNVPRFVFHHNPQEFPLYIDDIKNSLYEIDGYDNLSSFDKTQVLNILDAMNNYHDKTEYPYFDICYKNFGCYNGDIIVRDFEGGSSQEEKEPHHYKAIRLKIEKTIKMEM